MAALGEINISLTRSNFSIKLRALVVKNLQADCFGGTNFHTDNDIEPRITTGQIKLPPQIYSLANQSHSSPPCP